MKNPTAGTAVGRKIHFTYIRLKSVDQQGRLLPIPHKVSGVLLLWDYVDNVDSFSIFLSGGVGLLNSGSYRLMNETESIGRECSEK